jgi:hypothetical protein
VPAAYRIARWFRTSACGPAVASAAVALLVFSVTLGGTFVYDDFDVFALDARLRDLSKWRLYWTESYNGGVDNLYRPLVSMTYAVQWAVHGDTRAWPFHLVNWLLHAGATALVAELARRVIGSGRAAYAAGLLFAVHPLHVEAVANIVGRAELMSAMGVLGALVLFLHRPLTPARALAILACALVAVLSKEQGLLVPLLLLTLAIATRYRPADRAERSATPILVLALCWALAGYVVFRESILKFGWDRSFLDWTINPLVRAQGADRVLVPIAIVGRYACLLVAPLRLSPDYGGEVIGSVARWEDPFLWFGLVAIVAWVGLLGIAWIYRNGALAFALVSLALTVGLVSNLVLLIGTNFAERLMYLPSAFFLLVAAIGATRLLRRRAFVGILAVLVTVGAVQSFGYARRWNDRLGFYQWASEQQPKSIRLRMLVTAELMTQGRLDEAAEAVERAREILPEYDEIWIQSAEVAEKRGRFDEAERFLQTAMRIRASVKADARLQRVGARRAATQPASSSPSQ